MVIATTIYSCGPAALATILKNLGIYTTEAELAQIAITDETGTSLYGLKQAALNKGITAIGARLTIDQLQPNYLVVLNIDGTQHFEIIHNITNTTVYLYDPNLGDLEISREKFNTLYTGIALIINGQAPVNATLLTDDEMRNINAMACWVKVKHEFWVPGYWYPTVKWINRNFSYPTLKISWVPGYLWKGWLPIPAHYEAKIVWKRVTITIPTIVWKYHRGYKATYYTTRYIHEDGDQLNDKKIITSVLSVYGMAMSIKTMEAGIGMIGATDGLGTPAGVFVFGMGATGFSLACNEFVNSLDDPWIINTHDRTMGLATS